MKAIQELQELLDRPFEYEAWVLPDGKLVRIDNHAQSWRALTTHGDAVIEYLIQLLVKGLRMPAQEYGGDWHMFREDLDAHEGYPDDFDEVERRGFLAAGVPETMVPLMMDALVTDYSASNGADKARRFALEHLSWIRITGPHITLPNCRPATLHRACAGYRKFLEQIVEVPEDLDTDALNIQVVWVRADARAEVTVGTTLGQLVDLAPGVADGITETGELLARAGRKAVTQLDTSPSFYARPKAKARCRSVH